MGMRAMMMMMMMMIVVVVVVMVIGGGGVRDVACHIFPSAEVGVYGKLFRQ